MAGLHLVTSNRMERLAVALADLLREPGSSPLAAETIVVQSRGMERWLAQQIARRNGVCANLAFPFPNAFLERLAEAAGIRRAGDPSPFDPEALAFRLFALFGELPAEEAFRALGRYLENDPSELRRWELAEQTADLFDQYLVFRPEMIAAWERTPPPRREPHRWQGLLWRRIVAATGGLHRQALHRLVAEAIRTRSLPPGRLPGRVFVFGISYLPFFHLEMLRALSELLDVYFFLLSPCREYWADLLPRRQILNIARKSPRGDAEGFLHLEEGHPLLASLGLPGRQFLEAIAGEAADPLEFFEEPGEETLLHRIQTDLLLLRPPAPLPRAMQDGTVRVHSCHSPMREMEVLRDQLLALWEEDPALGPADVVVMAPDIERYAPYAAAVFGAGDPPIPFHVADRTPLRDSPFLQSVFKLLDLKDSRFTVEELLRILEDPDIAGRFGLAGGELARLSAWLRGAEIRWGLDEDLHPALAYLGEPQNTWKAGIERLLLGYALPAAGGESFLGLRGADLLEGSEAALLGGFLDFLERAAALCRRLRQPRPLSAWGGELLRLLEEFFAAGESRLDERLSLERALAGLPGLEALSGCRVPVPLEVLRRLLERRLESEGAGRGFLREGVTFCSMLPMRSIPFPVVCLLGLDHDAFPRETRRLAFDRMALAPRPGDRSRRSDDRYLFLEAILSARRRLILSYVGQDIQDNRRLPPSVLVSELLDTLAQGYGLELEDPAQPILVHHPLHPFSERYFRGEPALFSYSQEDAAALRALREGPVPEGFAREPLPAEEAKDSPAEGPLALEELVSFFGNPSRYFLRRRLGVALDIPQAQCSDSEPFSIEGLDRYRLGARAFEERLAGRPARELFAVLRAEGKLPPGRAGEIEFRALWRLADRMARVLEEAGLAPPAAAERRILSAAGIELAALLPAKGAAGVVRARFARVRAADRLGLWVEHLAFCRGGTPPAPAGAQSLLLGTDTVVRLRPPSDPAALLDDLVAIFREGRRRPIPFFPECSMEFFRLLEEEGRAPRAALAGARRLWEGDEQRPGESADPWHRRCHGEGDPLGEEFQALSRRVWGPLRECLGEEKLTLP